jgi:putative acetyltransferase
MDIEPEHPEHIEPIRALTTAAFEAVPYSSHTEARIVHALRQAGALTLSLVAIEDGEVLGHVAFSPVTIGGRREGWYGLGPVSVRPARQRQGIGQALIRKGLHRLQALGAHGCVLVGHPGYYPRFGFASDPALSYRDLPPEYLQRLVFQGESPRGEVEFHPAFDAA